MSTNHEMTFVCFDISKLECQKLNIIGYFFFISYMPMHDLLKRKNMQSKTKNKKNQNTLYMIASVYSRRCGSYRMYLEGDSPHQTIMIVYELKWFFRISNHHNMLKHLRTCDVFHTQHEIFFATLDTCASTMWFGHHKVLHVLMYAH